MFSVSELLDSAKKKAGIESDYRLAKTINIFPSSISGYRSGNSLPDERVVSRLCELSGDDPDFIAAQIQSRRASTEEARQLWQRVATRLQAGAAHCLFLCAIALIALGADSTRAATHSTDKSVTSAVYYVKSMKGLPLFILTVGRAFLAAIAAACNRRHHFAL